MNKFVHERVLYTCGFVIFSVCASYLNEAISNKHKENHL